MTHRILSIAGVLFAGCLPQEDDVPSAEGDHLLVHVVSDAQFDHINVALVDLYDSVQGYQLDPTTTYDYNHWETFNGDGPHDVKITLRVASVIVSTGEATSVIVGIGEATNIEYLPVGDGSTIAEITMHLTP